MGHLRLFGRWCICLLGLQGHNRLTWPSYETPYSHVAIPYKHRYLDRRSRNSVEHFHNYTGGSLMPIFDRVFHFLQDLGGVRESVLQIVLQHNIRKISLRYGLSVVILMKEQ